MAKEIERYAGCMPATLCGRKVWIAERGGHPGALKEIWVHIDPYTKAIAYLTGTSLTEGSATENIEYLESLVSDKLAKQRPITRRLSALWDADMTPRPEIERWKAEMKEMEG